MNKLIKNNILLKLIPFILFFIFFSITNFKNKNATPIYIHHSTVNIDSNLKGISYYNVECDYRENNYFKEIIYKGKIESIDTITLKINNQTFYLNAKNLQLNRKIFNKNTVYSITQNLAINKSILPYFNKFINWEGAISFTWRLLTAPIILILCFAFIFSIWYKKPFNNNSLHKETKKMVYSTFEWVTAITIFLAIFVLLSQGNNYFFLQDDNYIQFSPVITQSLNDFYTTGVWPTYNFYQNAGLPTSGYSIYSLNYVGTHFAFLISKFILNDVHTFCNVFCFIHYLLGFIFLMKLCKVLKIQYFIALIASLTFVFSGFNIMITRSWYYIAPSIFFVPFLTYLRLLWHNKFSLKKIFLFSFFVALYAYGGNVQFWIYTFCFWILSEILFHYFKLQKINFRFIGLSILFSVILFLPQLLLTIYETKGLHRVADINLAFFHGINDMVHPFAKNTIIVDDWGGSMYRKFNWVFFKCNFIFGITTFFLLFYFCFSSKKLPPIYKPLVIIFFISILYGSGKYGGIAVVMSKLPIFNIFSHPFKMLFYANFLLIIIGAIFINSFQHKKLTITLSLVLLINLIWQILNTKSSFHNYGYTIPYENPRYLKVLSPIKDYRILPIGSLRSFHKDYAFSMMHNVATNYHLPSLESLEVLNPLNINTNENYGDFSVRYIIEYNDLTKHIQTFGSNIKLNELKNYQSLQKIYTDSNSTVYENLNYTPLVNCYINNVKQNYIPQIEYGTSEINIHYSNAIKSDKILLTLNYREPLKIYLDNKLQLKKKDSLNRVIIFPTFDFNNIKIKYTY